MSDSDDAIDLVLPAHNEAGTIEATLREFHDAAVALGITLRLVISEDGSTDGTADVVTRLASALPIALVTAQARKGYSRAVIDGVRATRAQVVGFADADGQCDPYDLGRLVDALDQHDLAVGWRSPRIDHWTRLALSGGFKLLYRFLFRVPLRDPSCPYLLIRRAALARVMEGRVGILPEGFWWEFYARANAAGLSVAEIPIRHRARASGVTRVYRPQNVPRIAYTHLRGVLLLRRELRSRHSVR